MMQEESRGKNIKGKIKNRESVQPRALSLYKYTLEPSTMIIECLPSGISLSYLIRVCFPNKLLIYTSLCGTKAKSSHVLGKFYTELQHRPHPLDLSRFHHPQLISRGYRSDCIHPDCFEISFIAKREEGE